jgi:hypothetical protein
MQHIHMSNQLPIFFIICNSLDMLLTHIIIYFITLL